MQKTDDTMKGRKRLTGRGDRGRMEGGKARTLGWHKLDCSVLCAHLEGKICSLTDYTTHTRTPSPSRHLTAALTHLRALFPAQPIALLSAAGIPIAPVTMHAVIWVEQAASVVVLKLLLWCGGQTLTQRVSEPERQKERARESCTCLLHYQIYWIEELKGGVLVNVH